MTFVRAVASMYLPALLIPTAFSSSLHAQAAPTLISYNAPCKTCRIVLERVATLGRPTDPVLLRRVASLARDSRGKFYAISFDGFQIVVFDSTGKFLRTFGQRGQGPGEVSASFGAQGVAVGRGDTVFVTDGRKLHVFSSAFTFVRTILLPGQNNFPLRSGKIFINATISTRSGSSPPFHIVDATGKIERSFGPGTPQTVGSIPVAPRQGKISADQNSVWTVRSLEFEQWDLAGTRLRSLRAAAVPGFPVQAPVASVATRSGRGANGATPAPAPLRASLGIIGTDAAGFLWVNRIVPRSSAPVGSYTGDIARFYTMTVDVIDPVSGKVLASQATTSTLQFFFEGKFAYSASTDFDDIHTFTVWRATFIDR